jgi:DNA primase
LSKDCEDDIIKRMSTPVEDIKSRLDIVELIGSYLRLQKAGANFKANCPFHNEKTPSFVVSPSRQIWHCFGCSKGGDIFKFVMDIEGYDFPESLRYLADKAGVEVKREDPALKSERNRLLAVMEEATKFFESNSAIGLLSKQNNPIVYLQGRGLTAETIKEFRLGYAPDEWRSLFNHLIAKSFTPADIVKAGLAIENKASSARNQSYYDRFRGRIIFPIFDYNGRVVAFGGRIYPEKKDAAKYVNSPETLLYQKSKILYGLNKSKAEILREGSCVVVEGYTDMIMSWQAGVKNVVASSGTAFTVLQLNILHRLCDKLYAAFDMDLAGTEASRRGLT